MAYAPSLLTHYRRSANVFPNLNASNLWFSYFSPSCLIHQVHIHNRADSGHVHCTVGVLTGVEAGLEVFVRAVFYIGKGKRSRPYEHFKEAVTYYRQTVKRKVSWYPFLSKF